MNARLGISNEVFHSDDFTNPHINLQTFSLKTLVRKSMDSNMNQYGKLLLSLLERSHLLALNGRYIGDLNGKFTCTMYAAYLPNVCCMS